MNCYDRIDTQGILIAKNKETRYRFVDGHYLKDGRAIQPRNPIHLRMLASMLKIINAFTFLTFGQEERVIYGRTCRNVKTAKLHVSLEGQLVVMDTRYQQPEDANFKAFFEALFDHALDQHPDLVSYYLDRPAIDVETPKPVLYMTLRNIINDCALEYEGQPPVL